MKVIFTGNELAEKLITEIHWHILEWSSDARLRAFREAKPDFQYTVYGLNIHRGYPFYWLRTQSERFGVEWRMFPSICFKVVDDRPSSYWRIKTDIVNVYNKTLKNQIFYTRFYIPPWFEEPMFLEKLNDGRPREMEIMSAWAAIMDSEFDDGVSS